MQTFRKTNRTPLAADINDQLDVWDSASVMAQQRFQPLVDLVACFQEVERYYPIVFEAGTAVVAA